MQKLEKQVQLLEQQTGLMVCEKCARGILKTIQWTDQTDPHWVWKDIKSWCAYCDPDFKQAIQRFDNMGWGVGDRYKVVNSE